MKSLFTLFSLMVFAVMVFSSSESSHAAITWGTGELKGTPLTTEIKGVVGDATEASRKIS